MTRVILGNVHVGM